MHTWRCPYNWGNLEGLRGVLKVVMVELIICLILLGVSIFLIVKTVDNEEILIRTAIPFLIYVISLTLAQFYYGFAITRNTRTHLVVALFFVVPIVNLIEIGFMIYFINLSVTYMNQSSLLIFLVFVFTYQIIDSSYAFLLQSSILLRLKKVTRILSKGYKMRLGVIVFMDVIMTAFFIHKLATDEFNIIRLIFVVIHVVHGIIVSLFLKEIMKKTLDERQLPEIPKVQQAALLMEMSAEEGNISSAAA